MVPPPNSNGTSCGCIVSGSGCDFLVVTPPGWTSQPDGSIGILITKEGSGSVEQVVTFIPFCDTPDNEPTVCTALQVRSHMKAYLEPEPFHTYPERIHANNGFDDPPLENSTSSNSDGTHIIPFNSGASFELHMKSEWTMVAKQTGPPPWLDGLIQNEFYLWIEIVPVP